ncbi:MAG: hypothetical protein ACRDO4_06955 [Nocardioides sp.]
MACPPPAARRARSRWQRRGFPARRSYAGESNWLADRRHGHGTRGAFHTLAEDVSDEDLDGFFDAWLSAGKPNDTADNGLG